jgi:putative SOS response-associated peptidase YedK
MCGRFTLRTPAHVLAQVFGLDGVPVFSPRYNIAPTQDVLAVTLNDQQKRGFVLLRWGLIPSWADDPKIGSRMINARAESVRTKPSFRHAFKHNRCLILADGFFEWQKRGATKQPMFIGQRDGCPFAFAGLWERWQKGPQEINSCTIITTEANDFMRPVHDRMPVILSPADYDQWFTADPSDAEQLLRPNSTDELTMIPVGKIVNSPRNDVPECVLPVAPSTLF